MILNPTHWIKGSVVVEIRGGQSELLVNEALKDHIKITNIRWTSGGLLQFELSVSDYFGLRPVLKKTGCRAHVMKRSGLPFLLAKAEKRKFFGIGIVLFLCILYMLSSIIWSVEIQGNSKLTEEEVRIAAKQEGLFPMQWSFRLADQDVLSKALVNRLPGSAWVGVEKKGTKVIIQVVEHTVPEEKPLLSPRHLVATNDAVITEIIAEVGNPMVKKNTKVKKDQILISGIIGGEQFTRTVVAKGEVRGLVWYTYDIISPLKQQVKVYTGEKQTKWFTIIGSRALQISGFGQDGFENYETVRFEQRAAWRNWMLPIGRLKETVMEMRFDSRTLTFEEAKETGLMQARAEVLLKAGEEAVIRDEIVLHVVSENGKVYMKVLFEIEQSILKEQPIVEMQGD